MRIDRGPSASTSEVISHNAVEGSRTSFSGIVAGEDANTTKSQGEAL